MFHALYVFFLDILYANDIVLPMDDMTINIYGVDLSGYDYFAVLFALISFVVIFVLCCLFVYKIIKLVGNLIR